MRTKPLYCLHYTRLSFKMLCKNGNSISVIQWVWDYPQNIKNRAFRQSAGTPCFSGVGTHRICLLFCKKIPVDLRRAAGLSGMREFVQPHDPLLERQESRGICVPWIPPEWKILLFLPPYSWGVAGWTGAGVCRNCARAVCRGSREAGTAAKMWALRKPILDAHILSLQEKVQVLEQEIDEIVMEKIMHQI